MKHFFLNRQPSAPDGTFGYIADEGNTVYCDTCELPWLNNEPDKSCIPIGDYNVVRHNSAAHPNVWELQNVDGRTGILIHNGNTEKDSLGCIIVGNGYGTLYGLPAVLNSNITLKKLQAEWPDNFLLTVKFI